MPRKSKGMRPDGRCQIKRKMPDGKYRFFYGKTKSEAEAKYKEALIQKAEAESKAELFEIVAADYWDKLLKRIKDGTDSTYRSNFDRCVQFFSGKRMDEITPVMIVSFGQSLKDEGLSTSTIQNAVSILRGIFRGWRLASGSSYNPMQDIKSPAGKPAVIREPPTDRELALFRAHPEGFGLCAWMLMYTGCRLGELIALRWDDIDFETNKIYINKKVSWAGGGTRIQSPKTANGVRIVPLMPKLKRQIEPRKGTPLEYVIGGLTRPLTDAEYHSRWLAYCTELGLVQPSESKTRYRDSRRGPKAAKNPLPPVMEPTVTAHQFRHSFASDLYDAGVGVLEAKKIMGHADISTTYKIYTHIRERKLKDATEKMIKFYDDEDK